MDTDVIERVRMLLREYGCYWENTYVIERVRMLLRGYGCY